MHESSHAIFNTDDVLSVDTDLIELLKRRALESDTGRYRLCLHHSADEAVQEMIVVHCRENYSRPHCHPETASTVLILEGRMDVYLFDEVGTTTGHLKLGPKEDGGPFTLRLQPNVWHMPVCVSPQLVFYETMTGPFVRDNINRWAPWSPDENDAEGIDRYLKSFSIR